MKARRNICWACGRTGDADPLDTHHIFGGSEINRKRSEKYGLTVRLCHDRCHIFGEEAVHNNARKMREMREWAQEKVMLEQGWDVDDFRSVFGKNYLDDDKLLEIARLQDEECGVTA